MATETRIEQCLRNAIAEQGNLATLDATTAVEARRLQQELGSGPASVRWKPPLNWGSIELIAIRGAWKNIFRK